ncbi:MAG: PD-(D/E)XK nuclease family transposase [Lachnospiraceae bacterium]|nr:PD-(D/E)XK nuclease family transposase [Lachnospiraceae bacterium]
MAKLGLIEKIEQDADMRQLWNQLGEKRRQELREIDTGKRVPNFLSDTMFKGIFNPDINAERLSRFISSILGKKIKVIHSLDKEGMRHSQYSKGIVLDILAEFENGAIGNVEIQRQGIAFPPKRAAVYSANMLTRQYTSGETSKKSEVDYNTVQPVYTIIIMEQSPAEFRKSGAYIHHFRQRSDTGLELELLQYYDYICLDNFCRQRPCIVGELENWLTFLSLRDVEGMKEFLAREKSFQPVYDCAIMMLANRKELMAMLSEMLANEDIVASLNLTNESTIKRLQQEKQEILKESERALREKEAEIQRLKEQLKQIQSNICGQ